jgi:hypothetical protein
MRATPCNGNHGERGFRQDCQSNCQHLNEVAFSLIVLSENKLLLLCQFHIEFLWIPCTVFLHLHTCKNSLKDLPRQKCQSSRWWACSQLDDQWWPYIYFTTDYETSWAFHVPARLALFVVSHVRRSPMAAPQNISFMSLSERLRHSLRFHCPLQQAVNMLKWQRW